MTADTENSGHSGGSDTTGQSWSHISSAIPAIIVIVVLAIMALIGWYIHRRLRLTGRSILSVLTWSARQPGLSDIELVAPTLRHSTWDAISPVAVDFVSPAGRDRWENQWQRSSPSQWSTSSVALHSEDVPARYFRGHRPSEVRRPADLSDPEYSGLRVAVLIAMPSRRRGVYHAAECSSNACMESGISPELCLGTVHTSVLRRGQ
ncbi:hypothetical protein L226DRAFT_83833 [Lentinus tigrinus ALCF2SS1-7]|uniref:Uncharacterized protein n=1 Tax=Lentinus tigrinus ALCF2SS1-6 TaxID=1328759 RepID=A0A5C2RTI7_9APHY|nr:hypothetical protein L227DRAFT_336755 [Lentinus tigrinus ALCF2SS1-6]RPD74149.1 hypothetical protein L226DRAFT_83833 [Lentinus tigrinus ALCF2SS1-7]